MLRSGNGGVGSPALLMEPLPLAADGHLELRGAWPPAVHREVQSELVHLVDGQVAAGQGGVDVGVHEPARRPRRSRKRS